MWKIKDDPGLAEDNKQAIYRLVSEGLNGRNTELLDETISADFVGHDPDHHQPGRFKDCKVVIDQLLGQIFPDGVFATESLTAEDDMVVWHWTFQATHQGDCLGVKATGKKVFVSGVSIFRMANGKIVEGWAYRDRVGLLRQIGS